MSQKEIETRDSSDEHPVELRLLPDHLIPVWFDGIGRHNVGLQQILYSEIFEQLPLSRAPEDPEEFAKLENIGAAHSLWRHLSQSIDPQEVNDRQQVMLAVMARLSVAIETATGYKPEEIVATKSQLHEKYWHKKQGEIEFPFAVEFI